MGNTKKLRNFQKQLIFYYNYKFKNHFIRIRQKFDFVQSFFCKIQLNTYTLNNTAILNFRQLFSDLLIYSSAEVGMLCIPGMDHALILLNEFDGQPIPAKLKVDLHSTEQVFTIMAQCFGQNNYKLHNLNCLQDEINFLHLGWPQ